METITMKVTFGALALVAGCCFAGSVFAQCVNDTTLTTSPSNFSGNTCGKNLGLTSFCTGGDVPNGAGTSVVQLNVGNAANIQLTVVSSTSGFNPELAFISGSCNSLASCTVDDTKPVAEPGSLTVGPDSPSPQPSAGTSFIIISDLNAEAPGCGAYNIAVSGTLPVKLQDFSVQ
jgi:hypothetical protein